MTTPAAPLADESVAPLPTPLASPTASSVKLNEPVAAELPPPLPQISAGVLPAALIPPISEEVAVDPLVESIISNFGKLGELGIEYYEAADQSTVLYNPSLITVEELKEAESSGTLAQIAPPIGIAAEAPLDVSTSAPLAQTAPAPKPAGSQRLMGARIRNFNPQPVSPIQPDPVIQQLDKRAI